MTVHIWVDADSCPRIVRSFILRYAAQFSLPVIFIANKKLPADKNISFEMIICDQTPDAADTYIADHAVSGDLVITRDILFAARIIENDITVINDRGTVFTKNNIAQKISDRNYDLNLAQIGLGGNKSRTYSIKEFTQFTNCFDCEIHRLLHQDMQAGSHRYGPGPA
jgi:uncharacterized protein